MRLQHRCFPVNFVKFLRTPFLRTPLVADSEDEHNETKQLDMASQLNNCMICYELFWQPIKMNM